MTSGTPGLVLRLVPYGESDLVVTLFTAEHGRLSALARGGRRSKRRFAGALGLLVLGQYQLRPRTRGELWRLETADVAREWTMLAGDLGTFAHASYALDLVRETAPPEQPEPQLLDLLTELFDDLARDGASAARLRRFELTLLGAIGSAPSLTACVGCGTSDLDRGGIVFDPTRGGVVCESCAARSRGPGVRSFSPGARAYLLAAAGEGPSAGPDQGLGGAALDVATDPADRAAARDALIAFIEALVGRPLKSVEFIAKLGAGVRR